jgi:DNA-binding NarL/FixJ family response regulator
MTISVVVADDQPVVRAGYHAILDAHDDIDVVGEASHGGEAVALARSLKPDVVLMDIRMPTMDGIEATRQIVAANVGHEVRVLVLTTFDLDEYVYGALQAGASGFILKDTPRDELVRAVRLVANGDALLGPEATQRLIHEFLRVAPTRLEPSSDLTAREVEVLELLAEGMSNAEIANALYIGEATVKSHVSHVLMKLGLRDRVHAVIYAYRHGYAQRRDR